MIPKTKKWRVNCFIDQAPGKRARRPVVSFYAYGPTKLFASWNCRYSPEFRRANTMADGFDRITITPIKEV